MDRRAARWQPRRMYRRTETNGPSQGGARRPILEVPTSICVGAAERRPTAASTYSWEETMPIADRANRRQPAATPYQERLRAIGHRLDSGGWRVLCLLEDHANLVISATRSGETGDAG